MPPPDWLSGVHQSEAATRFAGNAQAEEENKSERAGLGGAGPVTTQSAIGRWQGEGRFLGGKKKTLGWEELQLLQPNLASTRVLGRVEGSRAECSSPKALDELHAGQGLEGVVGAKRIE